MGHVFILWSTQEGGKGKSEVLRKKRTSQLVKKQCI